MSKATEAALGALHGAIAEHLTNKLADESMSAAELAVAVKFLKDNAISVDPSVNTELADMQEALKRRRKTMASGDKAEALASVARELLQ